MSSTDLYNEIISYLQQRKDKVNALRFGSIKIIIQEGKVFKVEITEEEKRGKEIIL